MPRSATIELGDESEIPILYEDRSIIVVDKPAGWMLVPTSWDRALQNLQLAIDSSIRSGAHWARSRNIKFLRFIHRLDADTSGILVFARSPGAVGTYSQLFQSRAVRKQYLAVVDGEPAEAEWACDLPIGEDAFRRGLMRVDKRGGRESFTRFRVLQVKKKRSLLLAEPETGRTHQIRVHLQAAKLPIAGDTLYGAAETSRGARHFPLGLRAVGLEFSDPFRRKPVAIKAPWDEFLREFRFDPLASLEPASVAQPQQA